MLDWKRIGDCDFAAFGRRTISFRRSDNGSRYAVTIDQDDQDMVVFCVAGTNLAMSPDHKAISPDGVFRLSGGLGDRGNLFQIDGHAWTELLLTTPAEVSYYGNRVLLRRDIEVADQIT